MLVYISFMVTFSGTLPGDYLEFVTKKGHICIGSEKSSYGLLYPFLFRLNVGSKVGVMFLFKLIFCLPSSNYYSIKKKKE